MNQENILELTFRKAKATDNLEEIAELIYNTDEYIYPYWFGNLENCKKELPNLMLEDKFFYNYNNFQIAIDKSNNKIVGVVCIVDKDVDLSYDYDKIKNKNERYNFTVENYIYDLIQEVKESDFAYISNVCVSKEYAGKKIGTRLLNYVIEVYKKKIVLDVLTENPGAIHLYKKLGFEQTSEVFKGFNSPTEEKPDVISMTLKYKID